MRSKRVNHRGLISIRWVTYRLLFIIINFPNAAFIKDLLHERHNQIRNVYVFTAYEETESSISTPKCSLRQLDVPFRKFIISKDTVNLTIGLFEWYLTRSRNHFDNWWHHLILATLVNCCFHAGFLLGGLLAKQYTICILLYGTNGII